MGRRKKVLTEEELKYRQKSAERVKALKAERHSTYKDLAESIGISEATIRNYVHCRTIMDRSTALLFEQQTGIIWQYWKGETDCKTWEEHQIERFETACEAHAKMQEEEQRRIELYKALFTVCGFQYEDISRTTAFDFIPNAIGPHMLTCVALPTISAAFNDAELETLISHIREVIELECFKKSKQA